MNLKIYHFNVHDAVLYYGAKETDNIHDVMLRIANKTLLNVKDIRLKIRYQDKCIMYDDIFFSKMRMRKLCTTIFIIRPYSIFPPYTKSCCERHYKELLYRTREVPLNELEISICAFDSVRNLKVVMSSILNIDIKDITITSKSGKEYTCDKRIYDFIYVSFLYVLILGKIQYTIEQKYII